MSPANGIAKGWHATVRQRRATRLRLVMRGKSYRHYKGGVYVVEDVVVDEVTGALIVVYRGPVLPLSKKRDWVWCRPFDVFSAVVPDHGPRFEEVT